MKRLRDVLLAPLQHKRGAEQAESPVSSGSHLVEAMSLAGDLAAEEAADAVVRRELEERARVRRQAAVLAQEEVREAEAKEEASALLQDFPATGAELVALAETMRTHFAALSDSLPKLLALQTQYDAMQRRAAALRELGFAIPSPRVPRLGGMARETLMILDHASRAQAVADSQ